ncbi:MAG TPA: RiPP maturation radical SAM C-methyltransferase [Kofleriaceae bacterium]|nr:RiPP maturation radical SAM C-methyltransferase [Kofleriaceae bacterium]
MHRRVLLCAPPWRMPSDASLAIATLRPLLEGAGIACAELHGSLLFAPTPTPLGVLEQFSAWIFAPSFDPGIDRDQLADALIAGYLHECECGGMFPCADRIDTRALRSSVIEDMARADACIAACVEAALDAGADIIGFSATFESQLPASLAIARGVKARRPGTRIMLGGAACFECQGIGVAASFPDLLDAVCHTEGEDVIVPLVRALRGEQPLASVPGIAWTADGAAHDTPPPRQRDDLDALPVPVYDDWIAAFARSPWAAIYPPKLFFESSRGCWWGQKHLCSFCGLNGTGLRFRAKTPDRVVTEIEQLWRRFPQIRYLQATDNILDMDYLTSVLPRLAALARDPDRPLQMFFEIKSNLRKDQVGALADGGIVDVQPGIESLSDEVLALMRKGATGLGQIQLIKWATERGIGLLYNLLLDSPGEQAAWYDAMTEMLPALEHLPPPTGVLPIRLERFSPYHQRPESYGLRGVRPASYYRTLFRDPRVDLDRIAYTFDFDHAQHGDPELAAAHRRFVAAVVRWREGYRAGQVFYTVQGDAVLVVDRRGGKRRSHAVTGAAARLWHELDRHRTRSAIARAHDHLDPEIVDAALEIWAHRRWIVGIGDRWLCVVPDAAAEPRRRAEVAPAPEAIVERAAAGPAEIDVVPSRDPVHPWVCAATDATAGAGTEAWLQAAIASFATTDPAVRQRAAWPVPERELFLDDPRTPVDLDRLRTLARAARRALRHDTMLKLHLRVWPAAIDRRLVDHLSLLPIGSLELLAGSCDGAGGARPGASSPEVVEQALAALRDGGMSHVTSISLVVALPGQTPEDAVGSIRRAIALAAAARVRRIRLAFWLGDGAPCPDSEAQQHALFLASHPDWHPVEYAGVSDFVALMRRLVRGTAIIGPEITPGDHPSAIAGVLRARGVDDRLFDVIGVQLVGHLPPPSAAARGAAGSSPLSTPDCVVRSTSGRISLKVVPT